MIHTFYSFVFNPLRYVKKCIWSGYLQMDQDSLLNRDWAIRSLRHFDQIGFMGQYCEFNSFQWVVVILWTHFFCSGTWVAFFKTSHTRICSGLHLLTSKYNFIFLWCFKIWLHNSAKMPFFSFLEKRLANNFTKNWSD